LRRVKLVLHKDFVANFCDHVESAAGAVFDESLELHDQSSGLEWIKQSLLNNVFLLTR
jgi:hypothetical protein